MAGFLQRYSNTGIYQALAPVGRKVVNLGIDIENRLVKHSIAIGKMEQQLGGGSYLSPEILAAIRVNEVSQSKYIAYFDKEFPNRRATNQKFANNSEIEFILDTLADEAIVYDDDNYFAYPDLSQLKNVLKDDKREEIETAIYSEYRRIYADGFGFNDHARAWNMFRQFLVEGILAFEIIYEPNAKTIEGFKELDAAFLQPDTFSDPATGKLRKIWIQNPNALDDTRRMIPDEHIIYISYAPGGVSTGRTAYVERLYRSFQLLRHIENARVLWTIINSQFRTKMIVPVAGKGEVKAMQAIGQLLAEYKEELLINPESGDLLYNGRPNIPFFKNIILPANNRGEQTDVGVLGGEGPDMSDPSALNYFRQKLWMDSKIPFSRFQSGDGTNGGQYILGPESVDREEIRFARFISRLRSIFQEILYKPLAIQMALKYPELANDHTFRSALGIRFTRDNLFEQLKTFEVLKRGAEVVSVLFQLVEGEQAYFDLSLLIEQFLGMSSEDLKENKKRMEKKKKEQEAAGGAEGAAGGEAGMGGSPEDEAGGMASGALGGGL